MQKHETEPIRIPRSDDTTIIERMYIALQNRIEVKNKRRREIELERDKLAAQVSADIKHLGALHVCLVEMGITPHLLVDQVSQATPAATDDDNGVDLWAPLPATAGSEDPHSRQ